MGPSTIMWARDRRERAIVKFFVLSHLAASTLTFALFFGVPFAVFAFIERDAPSLFGMSSLAVVLAAVVGGGCLLYFVTSSVFQFLGQRRTIAPWVPFVVAPAVGWVPILVIFVVIYQPWESPTFLMAVSTVVLAVYGSAMSTLLYAVSFGVYWGTLQGCSAIRGRLRKRRGMCVNCGYDLTGLASNICPECGARPKSATA